MLVTPKDILFEMTEPYPGLAVKELDYFCIGIDLSGTGNQIFTTKKKGDNPPVYIIYHDIGTTPQEIENEGVEMIVSSLSDFFSRAKISEY